MAHLKLIREEDSAVSLGIVNQEVSQAIKSISRVLSWQEGLVLNWLITALLSACSGRAC